MLNEPVSIGGNQFARNGGESSGGVEAFFSRYVVRPVLIGCGGIFTCCGMFFRVVRNDLLLCFRRVSCCFSNARDDEYQLNTVREQGDVAVLVSGAVCEPVEDVSFLGESSSVASGGWWLSEYATCLIKNSLGQMWEVVANRLNFSVTEKNALRKRFLGGDEQKHLEKQSRPSGYYYLIGAMLDMAYAKGITASEIVFTLEGLQPRENAHLSKDYFSLASCVQEANQLRGQQAIEVVDLDMRRWDSYILIIWIKHPDKMDDHPLPNTSSSPVQQVAYDWAVCNPNKLVALCYSASALNYEKGDENVISSYKEQICQWNISNLFVLNLDHAKWPDESHPIFYFGGEREGLRDFLPPSKTEGMYFSALIDCLRTVLVFHGRTIIASIFSRQGLGHLIDEIPELGAAFDVDYIPIPFKTFRHPCKSCCRDATFDDVKYVRGIRMIVKDKLPNSMLAMGQAPYHSLGNWPTRETFKYFTRVAIEKPYFFATTHIFRMRDVQYDDSGRRLCWLREQTWDPGFRDTQVNEPLIPRTGAMPAYLELSNAIYEDDPMMLLS